MQSAKLTVLVPTYNSLAHLEECLDTVKWADELLICDSGSTDGTLSLAQKYNARIIQHEYVNSAKQKNWAIPQATYEWVLIVDSDEYLEAGLQVEIRSLLISPPVGYTGYRIPRKNLVFDQWISTCNTYPDYNVRLFQRDLAHYQDKEVHADVEVAYGQIGIINWGKT